MSKNTLVIMKSNVSNVSLDTRFVLLEMICDIFFYQYMDVSTGL